MRETPEHQYGLLADSPCHNCFSKVGPAGLWNSLWCVEPECPQPLFQDFSVFHIVTWEGAQFQPVCYSLIADVKGILVVDCITTGGNPFLFCATHTSTLMPLFTHGYMRTHLPSHMYTYTYMHTHVQNHLHIQMYAHVSIHAQTYTRIYAHTIAAFTRFTST